MEERLKGLFASSRDGGQGGERTPAEGDSSPGVGEASGTWQPGGCREGCVTAGARQTEGAGPADMVTRWSEATRGKAPRGNLAEVTRGERCGMGRPHSLGSPDMPGRGRASHKHTRWGSDDATGVTASTTPGADSILRF